MDRLKPKFPESRVHNFATLHEMLGKGVFRAVGCVCTTCGIQVFDMIVTPRMGLPDCKEQP